MNQFRAAKLWRNRFVVAAVAGLLLAASFPNLGIAGFAWIAPGLMIAAALGTRGAETFRIGYVAGLIHYLVSLYWLLLIPYRWHGIPMGPAAGWLALGAFLALFPATWVWLVASTRGPKGGTNTSDSEPLTVTPKLALTPAQSEQHKSCPPGGLSPGEREKPQPLRRESGTSVFRQVPSPGPESASWVRRAGWAFFGAVAWVAMEMFIARIFTGFPWDLLGVSQYQMIPLIQIGSVTGVYGVSFILVWTSLSLVVAAFTILRRPAVRSAWVPEIILPATVVVVLFMAGFRELGEKPGENRSIKVTFIQPSIPQTLIWDQTRDDERFADLIQLTQQALTNKTDLVLWPEAAVPNLFRWHKEVFEPVAALARSNQVWMIIGADDKEQKSEGSKDFDYFNSSFLMNPNGGLSEMYRKRGLVIFGEYVPLVRWLPFIKYLTPIDGGFTSGKSPVPFTLSDLNITTSVLICFEDVFPHLAREYVTEDTDFLVNITNNGWFGEGAAQWQHATSAVFRAIENGVPLLRCSNNGLTCWVDQHGRLRQIFRDRNGGVYGPGFMIADIPFQPKELRRRTFYNAHGDVFGWICVAWTVAVLGRIAVGRWGV